MEIIIDSFSFIISIIALVVAIVSLFIANHANRIEKKRDEFELEKGKTALLNLTLRYFILNFQRLDLDGKTLKNDKNYTTTYINELDLLAFQFDNLITNSYYTILFNKYSIISTMSIFLRKEIMFIKINQEKGQQYGYDNVVWPYMLSTLETLMNEKSRKKNNLSNGIEYDLYAYAKNVNNSITTK